MLLYLQDETGVYLQIRDKRTIYQMLHLSVHKQLGRTVFNKVLWQREIQGTRRCASHCNCQISQTLLSLYQPTRRLNHHVIHICLYLLHFFSSSCFAYQPFFFFLLISCSGFEIEIKGRPEALSRRRRRRR